MGAAGRPFAPAWRFWTHRKSAYFAQRALGSIFKASFHPADDKHESAAWTHALTRESGQKIEGTGSVRDVDFTADAIRVMGSADHVEGIGPTKGGRGRSVPMVPEVAQTLACILSRDDFSAPDDLVFPSATGDPLDNSALRRRYKAAQTRAKLRPLRFHDLRHTFGSLASRVAMTREVQAWLGHADARTTQRYSHHRPQADDAAKLARAFSVETPGQPVRAQAP